jgi:hypothetical protein
MSAEMYGLEGLATGDIALAGLAIGVLISLIAIFIGLWIYQSFAYMAIAKKNKQKSPGLAWIPFVGPNIVAYKGSKMHWWPWLLLIGFFMPFVSGISALVFTAMMVVWNWKIFEALKKPGWWAILLIVPIVNYVIMGIVAWSKKK